MTVYTIDHNNVLSPLGERLRDKDPRGLVWIYEPPTPRAAYVIGVDPSMGKTGWDRTLRTIDDAHTDNAAIEVIKVGAKDQPDTQVAEFAAPIDPYDLARYVNVLGRLYAGNDEQEQALCIIEIYPGPGFATQRELIEKYGYTNMFVWKYLDSMAPKETGTLGWTSSPKSVRDLWIKGSRHISNKRIKLWSVPLVEELASCRFSKEKMRGMAISGRHDDRVSALLMSIWAAHDWTGQVDPEAHSGATEGTKGISWQASDVSTEEMFEEWERKWEEWGGDD